MDTKALRQKILDLAIRGKLVPQDPNDEPASVLLERIREEKKQMVKDGKLKPKDIKNDTIIFKGEDNLHYEKFQDGTVKCIEDEIPFDEPQGWNWTSINAVAFVTKLAGFEYTKNIAPNLTENGIPLFKGKNVQDSTIIYDFESYIPEEVSDELARSQITRKCILTPYVGTIGNIGIHDQPGKYHLGSNVGKVELYNENVVLKEEWVVYYLQSQYGYKQLTKHMKATAQASISIAAIRDVYLPVPPAKEQERICSEILNIINTLAKIDESKDAVSELVSLTKNKILDLAIRGKLIPQDFNDEPASVLLERIRAEKEELIKQGKLKRDKKESIIYKGDDNSYYEKLSDGTINSIDEDLPFDIPDSWSWERVRNLFIVNPKNTLKDDALVSFIPMALLDDGYSGGYTYEERAWKDCKKGFTHFADGDVCFAKISPCFENRKSAYFQYLCNGYGAGTTELYVLRRYTGDILPEYLLSFVKSEYFISRGRNTFSGVVGQQRVDKEVMLDTFIPIPPLAEQARINSTLCKIFSEITNIEDSIR